MGEKLFNFIVGIPVFFKNYRIFLQEKQDIWQCWEYCLYLWLLVHISYFVMNTKRIRVLEQQSGLCVKGLCW